MTLQVDIRIEAGDGRRAFGLDARFESTRGRLLLFGASGAGKSLTLQAIAGLQRPRRGRICIGDRVVFDAARDIDLPARERQVGFLFQDYALFPHMDVAANIGFGLTGTFDRRLRPAIAARVHEVAEALGIAPLLAGRPRELSGGQRQRVALARALVRRPALLLLDEPYAALDIALRAQVRRELEDIRLRFGVPMAMVSHDLDDVREWADTLVLFESGRLRCLDRDGHADLHALAAESLLRGA